MVWHSYVYNTEYQNQRRIVKQLAPNIKDWLNLGLIKGFNYNHNAGDPKQPDHLSIRLDIRDSASEGKIESTLKSVGIVPQKQEYESATATEKYGYELGSKSALLLLDSIESGRIHEDLLKDTDFWINAIHGLINSSGIVESDRADAQRLLVDYCRKLRKVEQSDANWIPGIHCSMERMGDNGKLVLIKNMAGDIVNVPKKSVDVKMHKSQQF